MSIESLLLLGSAFSVGLIHTLLGPDHYVPFIAMAKARKWSVTRASVITILCGIGHVMSAFFLAIIGVGLGFTITKLNLITSYGGTVAAWFLIFFGLVYFVWGLRYAAKHGEHKHIHMEDGELVVHSHSHRKKSVKEITPWILFTIFILGPCEPLIPLIIYPAMRGQVITIALITLLFGLATIITMLTMVLLSIFSTRKIKINIFEKYGNAFAGAIIFGTGCVIKIFGL